MRPLNIPHKVELLSNFRVCSLEHSSVLFLLVAAKKSFQASLSRNSGSILEVPLHVRFQIFIVRDQVRRIAVIAIGRLLLAICQRNLFLIVLLFSLPLAFSESENVRQ